MYLKKILNSNILQRIWQLTIAVILILILPFHYVPSKMMMFPKNDLTFSYTIITKNDIEMVLDRFDIASNFEKEAINNEPIMRKLMEKGLILEYDGADWKYSPLLLK